MRNSFTAVPAALPAVSFEKLISAPFEKKDTAEGGRRARCSLPHFVTETTRGAFAASLNYVVLIFPGWGFSGFWIFLPSLERGLFRRRGRGSDAVELVLCLSWGRQREIFPR